jgi:hypothetical protein
MIDLFGVPLSTLFSGGSLITVIGIGIALWIRGMPDRGRVRNEGDQISVAAEQAFRAELLEREIAQTKRVGTLERTITRERRIYDAYRGLDRHRLNNITQCFDAMLMLLEMNPDRAAEIVQKIKEMRATQLLAEAKEQGSIRELEIANDEDEGEPGEAPAESGTSGPARLKSPLAAREGPAAGQFERKERP